MSGATHSGEERVKTDAEMRLTVATATKNAVSTGRAAVLERCIRSVAALPFPHEHLVRDGGSQDGTGDVLVRLSRDIPGLKVSSVPDGGVYDALNGALEAACGEWFLVLGDDDAIIDSSVLTETLEDASANGVDIAAAPVDIGGGRLLAARPGLLLSGMGCPHQGMLVRTSALREIGGFEARYRIAGDYDVFLRLILRGARLSRFKRPFSHFSFGTGLSGDTGAGAAEVAEALTAAFGLTEAERAFRLRNRVLPLYRSLRFLCHRSPFVRESARWQVAKRLSQVLGIQGGGR